MPVFKNYFTLFGLFLLMCLAPVQDYKFFKSIPTSAVSFTSDHLGNIYILKDDVLEKFDTLGNLYKTYNDKTLGKITYADVSNPLKIVIFYKEFGEVVFLDNMLAKTTDPVRLIDLGIDQASQVCFYYEGIWVYDQQNKELLQVNNEQKKIHRTGNISKQLDILLDPNFMIEKDNYLFLNNPSTGILVFDNYGTYYKTIPLKGLNTFQVIEDNIIYYNANTLRSFNIKTLEEQVQVFPDSAAFARIGKERLFLLNDHGINIYRAAH